MNFAELAASVAKQLSRDDAKKSAIIQSNPEVFFAMDAGRLDEMSAHEAATETLKARGVRVAANEDAVRMLEVHNMGVDYGRARARHGGASGSWGMDASDLPADNFLAKYLGEKP